jgi:hypothetical protein
MTRIQGRWFCCALLALASTAPLASAGEVDADLVCHRRPVTACYDPCCPPHRVGPVRRFFRRVFCPCCPPPCPVRVAPVVVAPAPPPPPAAVFVPPAGLDRPVPPPPPGTTIPGTGSALRRSGVLTPPAPPPPVRLDRMASRYGS